MAKTVSFTLPSFPHLKLSYRRIALLGIMMVVLLCAFFWKDIYAFARYHKDGEREVQRLLLDVRTKAVLPSSEVPGLATVTDTTKLNKGGVLAHAKNGDKVLLFYTAREAILYRPHESKVVAIGPIVIDASASQVKGTRITIKNGSDSNEHYQTILAQLNDHYRLATITDAGKATRDTYPKTIVIDATKDGMKTEFISAIDELIGGQKGIVPIGESLPANTDIFIIVGKE